MDRQLRRLTLAVLVCSDCELFLTVSLLGMCELLAGNGEEKLQAAFDKRIAAVEHLVFPEPMRHPGGHADEAMMVMEKQTLVKIDRLSEAEKQETIAAGAMIKHRESLAKLDDEQDYRCGRCNYPFWLPGPRTVPECPRARCGGGAIDSRMLPTIPYPGVPGSHDKPNPEPSDDKPETGWIGDCYVVGDREGTMFHLATDRVTTSRDCQGQPCTREQFEAQYPQARG